MPSVLKSESLTRLLAEHASYVTPKTSGLHGHYKNVCAEFHRSVGQRPYLFVDSS